MKPFPPDAVLQANPDAAQGLDRVWGLRNHGRLASNDPQAMATANIAAVIPIGCP
ncbi:hypothetical protein [Bradyrhizobium sp.]|uniref:hypothetical protein n=1 Tax=Bradyrhizobium sp. TaxID=376 RepID=UPI0025BABF94|nr:hypothetical protein [Bradyrhizobium sp.]